MHNNLFLFQILNNTWRFVTELGEMCEDTAECVVPSAVCTAGTCRCGPGLSPSEDNTKCTGKA
jgi:hypothetical protein